VDTLLINFSNYFDDLDFIKYAWVPETFINEEDDEFESTSNKTDSLK